MVILNFVFCLLSKLDTNVLKCLFNKSDLKWLVKNACFLSHLYLPSFCLALHHQGESDSDEAQLDPVTIAAKSVS